MNDKLLNVSFATNCTHRLKTCVFITTIFRGFATHQHRIVLFVDSFSLLSWRF